MKSKSHPTFLRLQISDDGKTALERQAARHGMSQTEIASRLVAWLVRQPPVVQASVLNNIDPGLQQDLAHVRRDMSTKPTTPAAGVGKTSAPRRK